MSDDYPSRSVPVAAGEWRGALVARIALIACAALLLAASAGVLAMADQLGPGHEPLETPIGLYVAVAIAAGLIFLVACLAVRFVSPGRALLVGAILVGLLMRAVLMSAPPMLDDDYNRFLWDGAVSASGLNPYRINPRLTRDGYMPAEFSEADVAKLVTLRAAAGPVLGDINHPELRTIYPPVAQSALVTACWIKPFSVDALRAVLVLFDLATLGLLVMLCRQLTVPLKWVLVYWWNPLVVMQTYGSIHMEVLIFPFVLGALLLTLRGRIVPASVLLALAVGVKVWPVLLLPLILRFAPQARSQIPARAVGLTPVYRSVFACLLFGVIVAVLAWPIISAGLDAESGFTAYARSWQMNDSMYLLIESAVASIAPESAALIARGVTGVVVLGLLAWFLRRPIADGRELIERSLWLVAAVFLLSPTPFPWYTLWFAPLLVVAPRWPLLVLFALLPIYHLREIFDARGSVAVFDHGVVWLQFAPTWLLLVWSMVSARRGRRLPTARQPGLFTTEDTEFTEVEQDQHSKVDLP